MRLHGDDSFFPSLRHQGMCREVGADAGADDRLCAGGAWCAARGGGMTDFHFYEPASGHGLRHDPFNAIVGPRPIGWISSRDKNGLVNLAPYSFFNAFNYVPPIVGFCSLGWKDSVSNIAETGEFVWNLAT